MGYQENAGGMTQWMFEQAASKSLTIPEALACLKRDARPRTVREVLTAFGGMAGMEDKAVRKRLADLLTQGNPEAKRDSVEKNVRTWMKDGTLAISRDNAIQAAYALKLSLTDAEAMIARLCGEGFHWRSPEDIVWIFGLTQGMSYAGARALRARLEGEGLLDVPKEESTESMTALVRREIAELDTEEALENFLRENGHRLGRMHNTAYGLFREFMDLLGLPRMDDGLPDVDAMSVREIISTYLYENYIPRARRSGGKGRGEGVQDAIQRDIRQNWPEEVVLSRMLHRQTDVTRKVLVLLFLACDGGESEYGDLTDETPEDVFQDMYQRMNDMLLDCGFAPLDSRVPFDWMVLYCMCADESLFIEDTVSRFLESIFSEGAPEDQA